MRLLLLVSLLAPGADAQIVAPQAPTLRLTPAAPLALPLGLWAAPEALPEPVLPEGILGSLPDAAPAPAAEETETPQLDSLRLTAAESSLAGLRFDGAARQDGDGVGPRVPVLPEYLTLADPEQGYWIAAIIEAAQESATARRVLRQVEALALRRGRPVVITVEPLRTTNGEYLYDFELVKLSAAYRRKPPRQAAHTLIHELLHVVQKDLQLPVDAMEMELEAHVVGLKVLRELGLKPPASSFELQFDRRFRNGSLEDLAEWFSKEYKDNISLAEGIAAYEVKLLERGARVHKNIMRLERLKAKREAVLERMQASGQPGELVAAYAAQELGAVESAIAAARAQLGWIARDLELLASPEGRARALAFGRRVRRWIRAVRRTYGD